MPTDQSGAPVVVVAEQEEGRAVEVAAPVEFVPCMGFELGVVVPRLADLQAEVGRHQEVHQVAVAAEEEGSFRTGTAREVVVAVVLGQDRRHPPMVAWVVHHTDFRVVVVVAVVVAEVRLDGVEVVAGQVHI